MPHEHRIPMRWADLDSLNHVNNVVYTEYAAEARAAVPGGDPTPRCTESSVQFKRPILLGRKPVVVTTDVGEDAVFQEIRVEGGDTVFATVETALTPPPRVEVVEGVHAAPFTLRRRDLVDGEVTVRNLFEAFQEIRIGFFTTMWRLSAGRFVVARTDVVEHEPVTWREDLTTRSWIDHVGRSSYTARSQLVADGRVLAHSTSILVGFDMDTQGSRVLEDSEREAIAQGMRP